VQEAGPGPGAPLILLLHGVGASTHTWRDVLPLLAETANVVAVDLPGQGFSTGSAVRMRLDTMAEDVARLIETEGWRPSALVGHSAGAAIALRVSQKIGPPVKVLGINPALEGFSGSAEWLFPAIAKLLALNPFTANMFSFAANRMQTTQIIKATGSKIDAEGLSYYTRLMQDRAHVNGALQMMAAWSLTALQRDLPEIAADTLFLTGSEDGTIPPEVATRAAERMPVARVEILEGLGHLAQEEAPKIIASRALRFLEEDAPSSG
jgi:magnesium chelatase accessory protein